VQLAADLIGLLSVTLFAVPAMYANSYARTVARQQAAKVKFGDSRAEEWRLGAVDAFGKLRDLWTPWKSWCLLGGVGTAAISYALLILKDLGFGS
jgi:hypothetical protein